jgi:hypothetical protein
MVMSAKFISGCVAVALLLNGCQTSVERASPPPPAHVQKTAPPAPRIKYQPVSLPAPAGWVLYTFPDERGSSVLQCAGSSEREWEVSSEGDGVKISPYREDTVQEPLPFDIRPQDAAAGLAGDRHVKRVGDGWLVGFDAGEFGGGLWWFSADGRKRKKLAEDNVVGFADSSVGVLALVGLAHMGIDYGKVLLVREGQEGDRPVEAVADLGSEPTAFATESADALIVATYDRVIRVLTSGEVERLLAPEGSLPYPNSLTLSKAGVIHVGMRHFVLRLSPAGEGYKEEWFVPSDCNKFKSGGFPCGGLRMCASAGAK